jgi:hypothetical protein
MMMKFFTAFGFGSAVLFAGYVLTAEAGALHAGKGTVLAVDAHKGRIVMTEEPSGKHALSLNSQTQVFNEEGSPISVMALQPGDLVREECAIAEHGPCTAKLIRLLRPAWMDLASPEM